VGLKGKKLDRCKKGYVVVSESTDGDSAGFMKGERACGGPDGKKAYGKKRKTLKVLTATLNSGV